ncbi:hypothetical protein SAMN04487895_101522 [Paenibacillus sophorae]|uniref:Uncharacterized protein n=1 Tax=Paenibacillus sophorae TaxID=1333845 RepID=A0A1H8GIJ5_9BACL|nr:hypothetical protein [Paenibacillus sophorae]QWU14232.1 hypothetical protein KP014_20185 [Paenibacillus sophorae]SEN43595.1 hypothetical protein SAMN04487895_101522 [Paenibacillus sophorae]
MKEEEDRYIYKYDNLLDIGYKQIYLTKNQHNSIIKRRKKNWKNRYEYYLNDDRVIMQEFSSKRLITLNILLYPVLVLMAGLSNFKELNRDLKRLFNEKKCGSFSEDWISKNTEQYKEIIVLIGEGN